MATTTMRELAVPSPAPAFTLSSGSGIDENQNSSLSNLKAGESQEQSQLYSGKNRTLPELHSISELTNKDRLSQRERNETPTPESLHQHKMKYHQPEPKEADCSNHIQDCSSSNNLESNSPKSEESKTESPESEDSALKSLRSARRTTRREDEVFSGEAEVDCTHRRKHRSVNNNESTEEEPQCSACGRDFASWSVLQVHLKTAHPDRDLACDPCHLTFDSSRDLNAHRNRVHSADGKKSDLRKKLQFDTPKCRIDRKNLKNIPKVIGFQDINFIDFSSEKFPLVAKDVCEKSLHLSKDEFCFECRLCGRGFPCSSALEIHKLTCDRNPKKEEVVKKNKRKSTPKFRPRAMTSESDESDDNAEVNQSDKRRNDFFNSLDLRNNGLSSKSSSLKSSEDEADKKVEAQRRDAKLDLADIQSMISVTNIPGINMNNFQVPTGKSVTEEKQPGLNIQVNNCQSSPSSVSNMSLTSPNFSVLSLISPNYSNSDHNDEEAQDCFAAECRRMKLRGEFPCKLCTQIFPNLRALKGHNRVHVSVASGTPSSPYRCNICSYSSLDKATLVRHMRSHNGDRPYECGICNYAFTTKANCERHLRNRHSKMTRDDVKSSIIYHPSEDPINDSEYLKTSEMNKKNVEKSKEVKHEFSLPINLKINLAALKERQKSEDLFQAEHQDMLKNISNGVMEEQSKSEAGTMTEDMQDKLRSSSPTDDQWSGEEALDLRVNKDKYDTPPSECSDEPEDLTKKEIMNEFNNNIDEKMKEPDIPAFPSPPYEPKAADLSGLVKMYSAMYPSLSMAQVQQIIVAQLHLPMIQRLTFPSFLMPQSVFHNTGYPKAFLPKDALGLQMSGGSIMDDNKPNPTISEKLQYFQQEALAKIILKREKDRIANDFYKKTQESPEKPRLNNEYFTESDKKAFQDILVNREVEKKPAFPVSKPIESVVDNRNASVKMVIKNGVLMPKQKQRRYRTERPFSCEHCSARFTLRSNMERHIKQQHPRFWTQKSRYNVGGSRKSDSTKGPGLGGDYFKHYETSNQMSIHSRGDVSSSAGDLAWEASESPPKSYRTGDKSDESDEGEEPKELSDEEESKDDLIIDEGGGNEHLRLLANVTEYLKAKQSELPREENQESIKESQPQDLASVSKMLDNAVTQTQAFQKYFQEGGRKEEDEYRRDDGDRSEEEEGLVAGSTSSDENRSEPEGTSKSTKKKKSAYSLAPNRVSCPYCFRKFPWTSSLRRHVLTHTGQKPFKCTHCPLLFTTKSNCDRHLLRKHGREALIASSGQTENHEGGGNGTGNSTAPASTASQSSAQNPNYSLRNVPERPYKCTHCPSSTFSSLSNLTKHMSSKHPNGQIMSPERPTSPDHARVKNINPLAPPNVTISPTFPLNIPKALSIIPQPQYPAESLKTKRFPIIVPSIRVQEWATGVSNGERDPEPRSFRKRSSSDETEASDRKRTSPDLLKISPVLDSHSDAETGRSDLPPIPASELPFKCHLCEGSFGERSEALDHIRTQHQGEFQLLMSKGALETTSEEDRVPHDDHDDVDHSRGRFPDYAHRKVMCAFCMRRFWSAEDLRRHMRTHTGERPFSCDVCQRKFTLKHSMLRHRKKHNAHDEVLVGSDEEHHNHVGSVILSSRRSVDGDDAQHRTILHQTLTRKEDDRGRMEGETMRLPMESQSTSG